MLKDFREIKIITDVYVTLKWEETNHMWYKLALSKDQMTKVLSK